MKHTGASQNFGAGADALNVWHNKNSIVTTDSALVDQATVFLKQQE
jgi:hypothetical protein